MTRVVCRRFRGLLDQRAAGLSEADRLVLENHLAQCEACSADATMLDGLTRLSDHASAPLPTTVLERAIHRALGNATSAASRATGAIGREHPTLAYLRIAAAFAFVLLVGAWWILHRPSAPAASAEIADHLISGEVQASTRTIRPGEPLPTDTSLHATAASVLAVAHGRVTAKSDSVVSWHANTTTVALESGALDVDVDRAPHRPFRVSTPRFAVEVLGTQFSVDLEGVRVSSGVVRVLSPTGDLLDAGLRAGESWMAPIEVSPPAAKVEPAAVQRGVKKPAQHAGAAHWLEAARRHLAARDLDQADAEIDAALTAHPNRRELAEAHTLRAERAQVGGDIGRAVALYLEIANQFADLPAGGLALFAAARLQANSGQNAKAAALFQTYLRRYPSGPFAEEARTRLRTLSP